MSDYAPLIALLSAVVLLGAWREYASDNRRHARLLAAFGAGGRRSVAGLTQQAVEYHPARQNGGLAFTEGAKAMLRVLVPSDGSPNSQYGVRHVVSEFMKNRDLEIHVLNVQRPFSKHIGCFSSRRARIEFHQEQAEQALKPVRQALDRYGIPYTVHTEVGDKAYCIADAARRLQCHRIVMAAPHWRHSAASVRRPSFRTRATLAMPVPPSPAAGSRSSATSSISDSASQRKHP